MRIDINNLASVGWVPDIPPHQLPAEAASSVSNLRFVDGAAERVLGYFEGYGSPHGTAREIIQARDSIGDYVWIYAHDTGVSMAKGEIHSIIDKAATTYSLADGEKVSLFRFNDRVIVNYPSLAPQVLWPITPTTDLVDLPAFPANVRCKRMVAFREYIFALGLWNGTAWEESSVLWSHTAEPNALPDSWDINNPAKDAGAFQLGETADPIVDAVVLGSRLYIFKENSTYVCEYVGYPTIFTFKRIFSNVGMLTPGCGVSFADKQLVVGRGDIYVHNGSTIESLLANGWQRWWRTSLSKEYGWKAFVKHYAYQSEVWVVFPTDGHEECNMALTYNYKNGTKSLRAFDAITAIGVGYLDVADHIAWDDFTGMWVTTSDNWSTTVNNWNTSDNMEDWTMFQSNWDTILGNKNVDHFLLAVGQQDGDSDARRFAFADSTGRFGVKDFRAEYERTGLAYGSVDRQGRPLANLHSVKLLREVWPRVDSDGPIMVQVGAQEDVTSPINWQPPVAFDNSVTRKVDVFVSGKLLSIRFFSYEKGWWRLFGYELEVETLGKY